MALRLLHIVDENAAEDGLRLLSLLLHRLPAADVEQAVPVVGPRPPILLIPPETQVHRIGRRLRWGSPSGPDVQRAVRACSPDLIHAWSATANALAWPTCPDPSRISVTLCDPADSALASRWWRTLQESVGGVVVCSSKLVQRRLVESGVAPGVTVVIRPGVDFGAIRTAKDRVHRQYLGLPEEGRVFLTVSPPSRQGGHFLALWAMAMLHQIWPDARIVVPGQSREQRRLLRLVEGIYCPEAFVFVADDHTPAELLAVSDALVVPASGDISTGWLAWAMAASVPVIGSAVPAVAEFIADRQNGFLCRPGDVHTLAVRIRTAFDSPNLLRQCADTARSQAYDVFRAQACVDQYLRLFKNLHAGRSPAEGVRDMAMEA